MQEEQSYCFSDDDSQGREKEHSNLTTPDVRDAGNVSVMMVEAEGLRSLSIVRVLSSVGAADPPKVTGVVEVSAKMIVIESVVPFLVERVSFSVVALNGMVAASVVDQLEETVVVELFRSVLSVEAFVEMSEVDCLGVLVGVLVDRVVADVEFVVDVARFRPRPSPRPSVNDTTVRTARTPTRAVMMLEAIPPLVVAVTLPRLCAECEAEAYYMLDQ